MSIKQSSLVDRGAEPEFLQNTAVTVTSDVISGCTYADMYSRVVPELQNVYIFVGVRSRTAPCAIQNLTLYLSVSLFVCLSSRLTVDRSIPTDPPQH